MSQCLKTVSNDVTDTNVGNIFFHNFKPYIMNILNNFTSIQTSLLVIFMSLILYLVYNVFRVVVGYFKTRNQIDRQSKNGVDSLPKEWLRPYDDEHLGI